MRQRAKRVLFLAPSAYVGGGVEEWLWSLAPALDDRGWETTVALTRGRKFHDPARFLTRYPYRRTVELDGRLGLREQRERSVRRAISRTGPDVIVPIHVSDALFAAARARRAGLSARLVACMHSQVPRALQDLSNFVDDVDCVVSVSRRGMLACRNELGIPDAATAHIPAGVPMPLSGSARAEAPPPLELAFIGRLDDTEKRVLDLARLVPALRALPVRIHVAGEGAAEPLLRAALSGEVNVGRVVFHGAMSRDDLYRRLYPRLHGLLIFSPSEGGPLVAWEALRHGVVPVTSTFLGMAEENVLRDGENCLTFAVGDIAGAAAAVERLADPSVWRALSLAGPASLPGAYSEAGCAAAWDACLRAQLERAPRMGSRPLSHPVSSGRLSRCAGSAGLVLALRRLLPRPAAREPGDEWPSFYGRSEEAEARRL